MANDPEYATMMAERRAEYNRRHTGDIKKVTIKNNESNEIIDFTECEYFNKEIVCSKPSKIIHGDWGLGLSNHLA